MVDAKSAGLHVGNFTKGLTQATARIGVTLHENAPVEKISRFDGTRHELVTARGTARADHVLVATSGHNPQAVATAIRTGCCTRSAPPLTVWLTVRGSALRSPGGRSSA
ncbi:hypothetical protein [Streptomyces iakyrus]|uniref:hypothetical protein n=1 Tax=Streptomyces iakyrus TaxID=68219 RepID=UPI003701CE72